MRVRLWMARRVGFVVREKEVCPETVTRINGGGNEAKFALKQ